MLRYLSLDIICSSKHTVFSEQIMSADKYPCVFSRQMEAIVYIFPNFQNCMRCKNNLKDNIVMNTIASIWDESMLGYLSLDIICSPYLTVFLELCSWKTVSFLEQITSADKNPSIFSCQMDSIHIYLLSK